MRKLHNPATAAEAGEATGAAPPRGRLHCHFRPLWRPEVCQLERLIPLVEQPGTSRRATTWWAGPPEETGGVPAGAITPLALLAWGDRQADSITDAAEWVLEVGPDGLGSWLLDASPSLPVRCGATVCDRTAVDLPDFRRLETPADVAAVLLRGSHRCDPGPPPGLPWELVHRVNPDVVSPLLIALAAGDRLRAALRGGQPLVRAWADTEQARGRVVDLAHSYGQTRPWTEPVRGARAWGVIKGTAPLPCEACGRPRTSGGRTGVCPSCLDLAGITSDREREGIRLAGALASWCGPWDG